MNIAAEYFHESLHPILMKRTILAFILSTMFYQIGHAQADKDTIIHLKQYSKYVGFTCILREDLINAVKTGDLETMDRLRHTTLALGFPNDDELTEYKSKLLTRRENIMLQFYNGEHNDILTAIKDRRDYFQKSILGNAQYDYPNFECGNLTLEALEFWKTQSGSILETIGASSLTAEEKELLVFYWEAILLYIESERTLSADINKKATDYLMKYPDTPYLSFVQELKGKRKVYRLNGMSIGLNFGMDYTNRNIEKYFKGRGMTGLEAGAMFNNWHVRFSMGAYDLNKADTLLIERIDTIQITKSSRMDFFGLGFKVGYTVFEKGPFRLEPFISGEMNALRNIIEVPDSNKLFQRGQPRGYFSVGAEASIRLAKNMFKNYLSEANQYSSREEKDRFMNPLYLTLRVGYFPETFKKSTGVSGGMLYWSASIQWVFGNEKAKYRHRK